MTLVRATKSFSMRVPSTGEIISLAGGTMEVVEDEVAAVMIDQGLAESASKVIESNGTYDVSNFSQVVVNVGGGK